MQGLTSRAGKWQVSTNGGTWPRWKHDGRELFFVAPGTLGINAVSVEPAGDGLRFGVPVKLFDHRLTVPGHTPGYLAYRTTPDGQRFYLPAAADEGGRTPLTVVVNWTALTK